MRNPNGYGTVYKLSGKRRRPWVAAITTKYELVDGKAKRTRVAIGYYEKKKQAQLALAEYNTKPINVGWTFKNVFDEWIKTKNVSDGRIAVYNKAFERFGPLHDKRFANITLFDLEAVMNATEASAVSKSRMKQMLNQMYAYALKYDIAKANLAQRLDAKIPTTKLKREPFSDDEIKAMWESDAEESKIALIMIYTGVRIGELHSMEIDREEWMLKGGSKTAAGKNRIVPIREKIRPLMDFDREMTYTAFYQREKKYLTKMGHKPHDCRVTFATRYKHADPIAIKLIMGHKIDDITKGVYTKYTPDELRSVIDSVDFC